MFHLFEDERDSVALGDVGKLIRVEEVKHLGTSPVGPDPPCVKLADLSRPPWVTRDLAPHNVRPFMEFKNRGFRRHIARLLRSFPVHLTGSFDAWLGVVRGGALDSRGALSRTTTHKREETQKA